MGAAINLTTDHDEIRRWAEGAGGRPVQERIGATGVAMPRIDFSDGGPGNGAEAISWDEWFTRFDQAGLALLYEKHQPDGSPSTFSKLVSRQD